MLQYLVVFNIKWKLISYMIFSFLLEKKEVQPLTSYQKDKQIHIFGKTGINHKIPM